MVINFCLHLQLIIKYKASETILLQLTLYYQKADDKFFVCKFSKNVKSKLYHTEYSKTRGQIV